MKENPRILLIYPPNQLLSMEMPRPDGSLGLLYLAGALEQAGFETDILDASVGSTQDSLQNTFYRSIKQPNGLFRIGMSRERIQEFIASGGYNVVGINSNFTFQTRMALEVAALIKRLNLDILVIAGGVNARNLSSRFLESGNVDIICLTEGEKIIVQIIKAWMYKRTFDNVSGILYRKNGTYVYNAVKLDDTYTNLDALPFPAWQKLPFQHYDSIISSRSGVSFMSKSRYAPIMTSRGCLFRCAYCHISMEKEDAIKSGNIGTLRFKSVDRVLEEVKRLRNLGVHRLYFEDDSLLAKKDRVKAIFGRIVGMELTIANINGVNLAHFQRRGSSGKLEIDVEYLELLKSAGFDEISFPVESGSQRILDKYATIKLNLTTLNVIELVKIASRIGIKCPVNMMIGFPDETEQEIYQSIELGKKLVNAGAVYCAFFIPIPFPGSKLFEMAIAQGYLDQNFDSDLMNWMNVTMKNTVVSPERIIEFRDQAWRTANTEEYIKERLQVRTDNLLCS